MGRAFATTAMPAAATCSRQSAAAAPASANCPQPYPQQAGAPGLSAASAATATTLPAAFLAAALPPPAALADTLADAVAYDNAAGSENLKTIFGVGYVALVAVFAVRLLLRRAGRAKAEVGLVHALVDCVCMNCSPAARAQMACCAVDEAGQNLCSESMSCSGWRGSRKAMGRMRRRRRHRRSPAQRRAAPHPGAHFSEYSVAEWFNM